MKASLKILLIISLKISFVISGLILHGKEKVNQNVKVFFAPSNKLAYQYKLGDLSKIYENEDFDKNRPTAIYIHGFYDDGQRDYSSIAIRTAYQEKDDTNFISIDWQYYSKCFFYKNAVIPQLKVVCEAVAENLKNFFDLGYNVDDLNLIGHSLGGQCIGLVGRHLKKISNYTLPRLYALDPAGPGYEKDNFLTKILEWVTFRKTKFDMISKDDAKYVQIIHTNGGKYGIVSSRGHADFFPNNGTAQAGCDLDTANDVCSHRRAWIYFQESVIPRKPFYAVKCDSYEEFMDGKCQDNARAIMGLSSEQEEGKFYLVTNPNPLFTSLGQEGLKYKSPEFKFESRFSDPPKWEESDIEFEKLLVVDGNSVKEEVSVKIRSALEAMGDDFEIAEESSGCGRLKHVTLSVLAVFCLLKILN